MMERDYMRTPVGLLLLEAEEGAVRRIAFADEMTLTPTAPSPLLLDVKRQLDAYFEGQLRRFDIPVRLDGTPFQTAVWRALACIPYGETRTYGQLAGMLGCPGGARAVGMALNKNPVVIVYPCHRVIGASGALTGFGGGIARKEKLLLLEGASYR